MRFFSDLIKSNDRYINSIRNVEFTTSFKASFCLRCTIDSTLIRFAPDEILKTHTHTHTLEIVGFSLMKIIEICSPLGCCLFLLRLYNYTKIYLREKNYNIDQFALTESVQLFTINYWRYNFFLNSTTDD